MLTGPFIVNRILTITPPGAMENVKLQPKNADETFKPDVVYRARRFPPTTDELILAGAVGSNLATRFELYRVGQTTFPTQGFRIEDADGNKHEIKRMENPIMGYVFNCICVRDI